MSKQNKEICCPKFDPSTYDGKTHVWKDKLFVMGKVMQIMHIPLNFGSVITKMMKQIEAADAEVDDKDILILAYDPSPWSCELYIHVSKEIPSMNNVHLSGTYMSKVFDGPFQNVPNWIKEMDQYLETKDKKAKKYYFYYTTCPKCAQKYGHNYCVAFAEV